jgi:hypothetical protein
MRDSPEQAAALALRGSAELVRIRLEAAEARSRPVLVAVPLTTAGVRRVQIR